jgi:hypothetical protein
MQTLKVCCTMNFGYVKSEFMVTRSFFLILVFTETFTHIRNEEHTMLSVGCVFLQCFISYSLSLLSYIIIVVSHFLFSSLAFILIYFSHFSFIHSVRAPYLRNPTTRYLHIRCQSLSFIEEYCCVNYTLLLRPGSTCLTPAVSQYFADRP